ncbi:MAG: hypothetical protein COA50_00980 [Flavobacteriaceae bacterium]|nr:MAG: hypothetical protein COA50_00980 [Flavobacteriaceae bacterium]
MKTIYLVTMLWVVGGNELCAQSSEYWQIEKTLFYYLDGGTNNDFETLKKAFHENATMKFISNDGYKEMNALVFFKNGITSGPKQNRNTSVISIDITGNAAMAKLKIEYASFNFIDYMQLLKIEGEWKIVNKTFYRQQIK